MYQALGDIVRNSGISDKMDDASKSSTNQTLLLSQVKPLLQRHWHNSFDDCGLFYYTEEGSVVKLKKMKHLLQALFRWRADRVAARDPARIPAAKLSSIDVAVKLQLEVAPSKSHNDLLLRCFGSFDEISVEQTEVIAKPRLHLELPRAASPQQDSDPSTPSARSSGRASDISMVSTCSSMAQEIERLRAENAQLRKENDSATRLKLFDAQETWSEFPMENMFDNPFEPPPEMPSVWTPKSAASTRMNSFFGSGSTTPLTDLSFSGSCTPVAHDYDPSMGRPSVVLMPVWFPAALGDRWQIPTGVVQQARAVFERHASIPSFFSQQML
jgi:hypothetical protein